ncbi:MAG: Uma2 family endonuclease [Gemmataceae bacterium]|nr:Uma2 family endonuclease [Gemmataceae bacterium]
MIQRRMTIDDLYDVEGPAELINGQIIRLMTGERPGEVAFNIGADLRPYVKKLGRGKVLMADVGYAVPMLPSGREAFCPDAAYHRHSTAMNRMRFVPGAPHFAIEVRSENDYGPAAERDMADKRADYFASGTEVVWDVDPVNETVAVYRATDPDNPAVFRRGETADAEPSVPGWRMAVDEVFA